MTSIKILSNRANQLAEAALYDSKEVDTTAEIFDFAWPESSSRVYFAINKENKLCDFSYSQVDDFSLKVFLEAFIALFRDKSLESLKELSAREMDYFLRDSKHESSFSDIIIIEVWTKYIKKMVKEISKALLKNSQAYAYTYDRETFGVFSQLGPQLKKERLAGAIDYYRDEYFKSNKDLKIKLEDVDGMVVVLKIENSHDKEHILENLRVFLNDVFNEKEFNTIADF